MTELGLSVEAAKDLREREKELESVYEMLDQKRKKEKVNTTTARYDKVGQEGEAKSRPNKQKW